MTTNSDETRCHGLDRRCTLEDWRKPSGHPGPWECDGCGNERLIVGHWKGDQCLCSECDADQIDWFKHLHPVSAPVIPGGQRDNTE